MWGRPSVISCPNRVNRGTNTAALILLFHRRTMCLLKRWLTIRNQRYCSVAGGVIDNHRGFSAEQIFQAKLASLFSESLKTITEGPGSSEHAGPTRWTINYKRPVRARRTASRTPIEAGNLEWTPWIDLDWLNICFTESLLSFSTAASRARRRAGWRSLQSSEQMSAALTLAPGVCSASTTTTGCFAPLTPHGNV